MDISYFNPFSRAWDRMKKILFQPFDISKWFMLGFTAFLAGLLDGGGSGSGGNTKNDIDWYDLAHFPEKAWDWLLAHTWWMGLIIFGIIFLFALIIVFNWLSSRGKFMFLDNVVHNRAEVTKPWHDFKVLGNSLFLWRLVYGFIVFIVFMIMFTLFFITFRDLYNADFPRPRTVFSVMSMVMVLITFIAITGYITAFLDGFIVPIMYKTKLSTTKAWGRFLPLFASNFWYFILYGIFVFVLFILLIIAIIIFGFATCCIGFVFLIIPYIGSVVLLPVSVTFRAFSVEFLEQFGDDYKIFPDLEILEKIE